MRTCLLFDIDGTLMTSEGAGRAALARAYEEATGVEHLIDGIPFHGRTDTWIFGEVMRRTGLTLDRERFLPRYYEVLEEELGNRGPQALPGVGELLEALQDVPDVELVLGTGNMRRGAFIKLRHVGLDRYFSDGGFGDEHEDRTTVIRDAVAAARWQSGDRLVVIGDTEHDVAAAHAVGADVVAVATGMRTAEELRAAGATVVLDDLRDRDHSLQALLGERTIPA
jgi:phosphoglycolate phosphatase-like HAD superfamily hydrolase